MTFPLRLALFLSLLVVLSSCTRNVIPPDIEQYDLEYCKDSIRTAQLELSVQQHSLEAKERAVSEAEKDLEHARTVHDQEKVAEKKDDLDRAHERSEAQADAVKRAESALRREIDDCTTLSQKRDQEICIRFIDETQKNLARSEETLQQDRENREESKDLLAESQQKNTPNDVLHSIQKDIEYASLEILKETNRRDRYRRILKQLHEKCQR